MALRHSMVLTDTMVFRHTHSHSRHWHVVVTVNRQNPETNLKTSASSSTTRIYILSVLECGRLFHSGPPLCSRQRGAGRVREKENRPLGEENCFIVPLNEERRSSLFFEYAMPERSGSPDALRRSPPAPARPDTGRAAGPNPESEQASASASRAPSRAAVVTNPDSDPAAVVNPAREMRAAE